MLCSGWGRYPKIDANITFPRNAEDCKKTIKGMGSLIARGLGRSYGDSSLGKDILNTQYLNGFIAFDESTGLLTCYAATTLFDILQTFIPKGWFLPVVPGTQFVTVGGAIASDIHGKNHHIHGTFSQYTAKLDLILGNGEFISTSPAINSDLFHATCGGMGLTGVIATATIALRRIKSSQISEKIFKSKDLGNLFEILEDTNSSTYSVAWLDSMSRGCNLGRSLLMLGEHKEDGELEVSKKNQFRIPIDPPINLINNYSAQAFNAVYFHKIRGCELTRIVNYQKFFFPLDQVANWNKLYGTNGFIQYQFAIPKEVGRLGIEKILNHIANSNETSFLAVLKTFGPANKNLLSFPLEGFTLAVDFKLSASVFTLLNQLDRMVLDFDGRLYLTKDSRMSEATFKMSYPNWSKFQEVRSKYHALEKFSSNQSIRLGLK